MKGKEAGSPTLQMFLFDCGFYRTLLSLSLSLNHTICKKRFVTFIRWQSLQKEVCYFHQVAEFEKRGLLLSSGSRVCKKRFVTFIRWQSLQKEVCYFHQVVEFAKIGLLLSSGGRVCKKRFVTFIRWQN
jgi:hypothetical protein